MALVAGTKVDPAGPGLDEGGQVHRSLGEEGLAHRSFSEGGWATPEEAAATLTLLRAPAAIAAACFLGGAILGQAVWSSATPEARTFAVLRCLAVGVVCLPFLLATKHYRPGRPVMHIWLVAAAVAASARSIQLVVSLFPLPLGAWLIAVAMQAGLVAIVWLAVYAVRRGAAMM